MDDKKPPLGLVPRWVINEKRIVSIVDAMNRYIQAGYKIPISWVREYNDLIGHMKQDEEEWRTEFREAPHDGR